MKNGHEYRVVWRRQQRRWDRDTNEWELLDKSDRSTRRFGTLEGAEKFRLVLLGRGHEAYGVDPDAYQCCHGEDGCGGLTNREWYEKRAVDKTLRPLVGEPMIERRPYGEWESVSVRDVVEG